MKTTVTIQIGNSDNKLTQAEWAAWIEVLHKVLQFMHADIHFSGGSSSEKPWQNYCFVCCVRDTLLPNLRKVLKAQARVYKQDSIALTVGTTKMIKP